MRTTTNPTNQISAEDATESGGATTGLAAGAVASARAELLRLRRWPAVWVIVAAWLLLTALFGYLFTYLSYTTGEAGFGPAGAGAGQLLPRILPTGIPDVLMQGAPMFGGALMLTLGALAAGSGYGWGTWKTMFTQGPSRSATTLGSLTALTAVVLATVLATLVLCTGLSVTIALVEAQPIGWPSASALAQGAGTAFLVLWMWSLIGFLFGTLTRGTSLAVGLGLVWALVVENLLRGVGALLGPIEAFVSLLPGTAAGSLVGAVGGGGGTPGVLDVLSGSQATWTLIGYVVLAPVLTLLLVRRRDVP